MDVKISCVTLVFINAYWLADIPTKIFSMVVLASPNPLLHLSLFVTTKLSNFLLLSSVHMQISWPKQKSNLESLSFSKILYNYFLDYFTFIRDLFLLSRIHKNNTCIMIQIPFCESWPKLIMSLHSFCM